MKNLGFIFVTFFLQILVSCASSGFTALANGNDILKYKYVVFGTDDKGDAELADILMMVQNDISEKQQVVSVTKASSLILQGEYVLSPIINIKSEMWDGGHTYITISFYDYNTKQSIAVVKSKAIGWTVSHDQKLAYKAIKKQLDKAFK